MAEDEAVHSAWVIGAGGLLGAAVCRQREAAGTTIRRAAVPWDAPAAAGEALRRDVDAIQAAGTPVDVYWCAGAGVIGTAPDVLDQEVENFRHALDALAPLANSTVRHLFLASSAGGVYGTAGEPPYTEHTAISPNGAYGSAKVAMEDAARGWASEHGARVLLGRISTVYGPGQDLSKPQGLIAQLCRSHLQRQPLSIYVSLDLERDFIHVDDAAHIAVAATARLASVPAGSAAVKIIASEAPATIGAVIGDLRRITRRRPPVAFGASPLSAAQSPQLRYQSVVWPELNALASTGLVAGLASTLADIAYRLRLGEAA
jgi:UDP-glucose 4-epimerase